MVDILKRRQLEVNLVAKEIFNDQRYSISYSRPVYNTYLQPGRQLSLISIGQSKAIARFQLLNEQGDWRNDYEERVFDTTAQATKFLKEVNLDDANTIFESRAIEDEYYEF